MIYSFLLVLVLAVALPLVYRRLEPQGRRRLLVVLALVGWTAFAVVALWTGSIALICAACILIVARLLAWHSAWPSPTSVGSWFSTL